MSSPSRKVSSSVLERYFSSALFRKGCYLGGVGYLGSGVICSFTLTGTWRANLGRFMLSCFALGVTRPGGSNSIAFSSSGSSAPLTSSEIIGDDLSSKALFVFMTILSSWFIILSCTGELARES